MRIMPALALLASMATQPLWANSGEEDYIRIRRDEAGTAQALQTSIVRYQPAADDWHHEGVTVDLVGVIHIADEQYYSALQTVLDQYDVVLYELVAPEGTKPGKKSEGGEESVLSSYYGALKHALRLSFQLESINYSGKNFRHADLPPELVFRMPEVKVIVESVKELVNTLTQQQAAQSTNLVSTPDISYEDLLYLALDPDFRKAVTDYITVLQSGEYEGLIPVKEYVNVLASAVRVPTISVKTKRFMAEQLSGSFAANPLTQIKLFNERLVTERNEHVVKELETVLGEGHKKVAIFYGAAHMPDMAKRIEDQFGFKRNDKSYWFTAWDLGL